MKPPRPLELQLAPETIAKREAEKLSKGGDANNAPSIREILAKYANTRGLRTEHLNLPNQLGACHEHLAREIYNGGEENGLNKKGETMTFVTYHPEWKRFYFLEQGPMFWHSFKCPVGAWIFLPHAMYVMTVPSGNPAYRALVNYGDSMFKGNKLPSRPEEKKTRFFL